MATVRIQSEAFDSGAEIEILARAQARAGAVVSFTGYVRDYGADGDVRALELEHYPGMTEKCLRAIADEASSRWPLLDATIVHRVGLLHAREPIVLVAVASAHRHAAFEACAYIMDYLKTRAPFWKKEYTETGGHWVDAREGDEAALRRWETGASTP